MVPPAPLKEGVPLNAGLPLNVGLPLRVGLPVYVPDREPPPFNVFGPELVIPRLYVFSLVNVLG